MSHYLTCEANLNFPFPQVERLVAELRAMYDGKKPVTTKMIATAVGCETMAVEDALRRASHCGLVRRTGENGWAPTTT